MVFTKFVIQKINPEKPIVIGRPFRLNISIDTSIPQYVKGKDKNLNTY